MTEHKAGTLLDAEIARVVMGLRTNTTFAPMAKPYSTQIAAAMEIAIKLKLHTGPSCLGFYCSNQHNFNDPEIIIEFAKTLPLAICLASLKAVTPRTRREPRTGRAVT